MKRELAVPRLLGLLTRFWSEHMPGQVPPEFRLYGSHSCKATTLAWSRQLNLDKTLRQLQGHHRLSGPDRSVELYGRDDVAPQLLLQRQLISRIRGGFRPLQPLARGSSVPLPDFGVSLPPPAQPSSALTSAPIATVARADEPLGSPEVGPATTPGSASPASVVEPTTAPFPPAPPAAKSKANQVPAAQAFDKSWFKKIDGVEVCMRGALGRCKNPQCKFTHRCPVPLPSGKPCGQQHTALEHTKTKH